MSETTGRCPDCDSASEAPTLRDVTRRDFLMTAGVAAVASALPVAGLPRWAQAAETKAASGAPETLVKTLYDSFSDAQKKDLCFAWDYQHPEKGLLRTRVENNWNITPHEINGDYFNDDQRAIVRGIYEGILEPEWIKRVDRQLEDDAGGYGEKQSLAIFGKPGEDKFEFVMTGRHMTLRCDGNSAEHVAFGGPVFYGHAANGFNEEPTHPGNVYWHQAVEANKLFEMLDGKQRKAALVAKLPREQDVSFRGAKGQLPGIQVTELSSDQKEFTQHVLKTLIEHYRQSDRDEVTACLKAQGGLDRCALAFYQEGDVGNDKVWDCWRLEGPAFVWYFRGNPHVHVWVNVASDPSVKTNT